MENSADNDDTMIDTEYWLALHRRVKRKCDELEGQSRASLKENQKKCNSWKKYLW